MSAPFQIPVSDEQVEFFEFTVPGSDAVHKLPLMQFINAGQAQMLAEGNILGCVFDLSPNAKTLAVLRKLSRAQVAAFAKAWKEASDITPGESSAS